jgi:N-acetylmuramoyl-L-alanine amidase
MWLERVDARVNGEARQMDVVPVVNQGRTLIPVRFVAEYVGAAIEWIGSSQMVVIVYPK